MAFKEIKPGDQSRRAQILRLAKVVRTLIQCFADIGTVLIPIKTLLDLLH